MMTNTVGGYFRALENTNNQLNSDKLKEIEFKAQQARKRTEARLINSGYAPSPSVSEFFTNLNSPASVQPEGKPFAVAEGTPQQPPKITNGSIGSILKNSGLAIGQGAAEVGDSGITIADMIINNNLPFGDLNLIRKFSDKLPVNPQSVKKYLASKETEHKQRLEQEAWQEVREADGALNTAEAVYDTILTEPELVIPLLAKELPQMVAAGRLAKITKFNPAAIEGMFGAAQNYTQTLHQKGDKVNNLDKAEALATGVVTAGISQVGNKISKFDPDNLLAGRIPKTANIGGAVSSIPVEAVEEGGQTAFEEVVHHFDANYNPNTADNPVKPTFEDSVANVTLGGGLGGMFGGVGAGVGIGKVGLEAGANFKGKASQAVKDYTNKLDPDNALNFGHKQYNPAGLFNHNAAIYSNTESTPEQKDAALEQMATAQAEVDTRLQAYETEIANATTEDEKIRLDRERTRYIADYYSPIELALSAYKNHSKQQRQEQEQADKIISDEQLQSALDLLSQNQPVTGSQLASPTTTPSTLKPSNTNTLVGIVGSSKHKDTGIGTGDHLDIRYSKDSYQGVRPRVSQEHLDRFIVEGKPLSQYRISSDYGQRKAPVKGASTMHEGIDFPLNGGGTQIHTNYPVANIEAKRTKGGGGITTVTFTDGVKISLLHQNQSGVDQVINRFKPNTQPQTKAVNYATISTSKGNGYANNLDLIKDAARLFDVDVKTSLMLVASESAFNPAIKNSQKGQSAAGLYQFTDGTWKAMLKKYGTKYGIPADAKQSDARANAILGNAYIKEHEANIKKNGREVTPTDIYMNHFLGHGGYNQFVRAYNKNPNALVSTVLKANTISVNKIYTVNKDGSLKTLQQMYDALTHALETNGKKYINEADLVETAPTTDTPITPPTGEATEQVADTPEAETETEIEPEPKTETETQSKPEPEDIVAKASVYSAKKLQQEIDNNPLLDDSQKEVLRKMLGVQRTIADDNSQEGVSNDIKYGRKGKTQLESTKGLVDYDREFKQAISNDNMLTARRQLADLNRFTDNHVSKAQAIEQALSMGKDGVQVAPNKFGEWRILDKPLTADELKKSGGLSIGNHSVKLANSIFSEAGQLQEFRDNWVDILSHKFGKDLASVKSNSKVFVPKVKTDEYWIGYGDKGAVSLSNFTNPKDTRTVTQKLATKGILSSPYKVNKDKADQGNGFFKATAEEALTAYIDTFKRIANKTPEMVSHLMGLKDKKLVANTDNKPNASVDVTDEDFEKYHESHFLREVVKQLPTDENQAKAFIKSIQGFDVKDKQLLFEKQPTDFTLKTKDNMSEAEKDKATYKAGLALKSKGGFIGFGDKDSSTQLYADQFNQHGHEVNPKQYKAKATYFASVDEGKHKEHALKEITKALDSGAKVLLDSDSYIEQNSDNKTGESWVHQQLKDKGYEFRKLKSNADTVAWFKPTKPKTKTETQTDKLDLSLVDDTQTTDAPVKVEETKPTTKTKTAKLSVLDRVTPAQVETELAKPYEKRNQFIVSFIQRGKTTLSNIANVLSGLKEKPTDILSNLYDEKTSMEQLAQLDHFVKFADKFNQMLKDTFVEKAVSTKTENKDKDYRYQDLKGYLLNDDGSFDENVLTALSLSAYAWFIENGNKTMNTRQDLNFIFGLDEKSNQIPKAIADRYRYAGTPKDFIVNKLGNKAIKLLDIKDTPDALTTAKSRLALSLGDWVLASMFEADLIYKKAVTGESFKADAKAIGVPVPNELADDSELTFVNIVDNAEGKPHKTVTQIIETNKGTKGFLSKVFGQDIGLRLPQFKKPTSVNINIKGSNAVMSKAQRKAVLKMQQEPIKLSLPMVESIKYLQQVDENFLLDLIGGRITEEQLAKEHSEDRDNLKAKVQGVKRELDNGLDFINSLHKEANGDYQAFYDSIYSAKNTRMHYNANAFNFQTSTLHRAMAEYANFTYDLDLNVDSIYDADGKPTQFSLFIRSIAENAEGTEDLIKAMYGETTYDSFTVDKLPSDSFVPTFYEYLITDPDVKKAVDATTKLLNQDTLNQADKQAIKTVVDLWDMQGQSLRALIDYTRYVIALGEGKDNLTVSLGLGSDGVNNGSAISYLLTGTANKALLEQVGIFSKDSFANYYDSKASAELKDYYTGFGLVFNQLLDTQPLTAVKQAVLKLNTNLQKRKTFKAVLIPFGYGAGKPRIKAVVFDQFLTDTKATLTEIANKANEGEDVNSDYQALQHSLQQLLGAKFKLPPANELLDFWFEYKDLNTLYSVYDTVVGETVEGALDAYTGEFSQARNHILAYHSGANAGFMAIYGLIKDQAEQQIKAKIKTELQQEGKKATDSLIDWHFKMRGFTNKEYAELIDKPLQLIKPSVSTAFDFNHKDDKFTSIELFATDTVSTKDRAVDTKYRIKENGEWKTKHSRYSSRNKTITEAGVFTNSAQVQSTDAYVTAQASAYGGGVNINIHDQNIGGIPNYLEMVKTQNKAFFEKVATFHQQLDAMTALMGFLSQLKKLEGVLPKQDLNQVFTKTLTATMDRKQLKQFNNKEIKPIDYLRQLIDNALAQDSHKIDLLKTVSVVHQYAGEGGEYVLTDVDYQLLDKQLEIIRKQKSLLHKSITTLFNKPVVTTLEHQKDSVKKQYQATDSWLKAPNGKATKLTQDEWLLVRTPSFKAWFGDWETRDNATVEDTTTTSYSRKQDLSLDPETGEPRVFFHGTKDEFVEFDLNHPNRKDFGWLGRGAYLTTTAQLAKAHAMNKKGNKVKIMRLFAKATQLRQLTSRNKQEIRYKSQEQIDKLTHNLTQQGYNGTFMQGINETWGTEIAIFDPTDIKHADGKNIPFTETTANDKRQDRHLGGLESSTAQRTGRRSTDGDGNSSSIPSTDRGVSRGITGGADNDSQTTAKSQTTIGNAREYLTQLFTAYKQQATSAEAKTQVALADYLTDKLFKLAPNLVIKKVNQADMATLFADDTKAKGAYADGTIYLLDSFIESDASSFSKIALVLHEMLHAVSEDNIHNPQNQTAQQAKQRLEAIHQQLQHQLTATTEPVIKAALSSVSEMIAYGLTDPTVMTFITENIDLKQANVASKKGRVRKALIQFLTTVADLFGWFKKTDKGRIGFTTFVHLVDDLAQPISKPVSPKPKASEFTATDKVNQLSATEVLTQLNRGNISDETNARLDSIIASVMNHAYAHNVANTQKVNLSKGIVHSAAVNAGFNLSTKEATVNEMLIEVFKTFLKEHSEKVVVDELESIYVELQKQLTIKDMLPNYDFATTTQQKQARLKHEYLFKANAKNKQGYYLPRLMALVASSEEFHDILNRTRQPIKQQVNEGWFDKVMGIIKQVFDWLQHSFLGTNPSQKTNEQLLILTQKLVDIDIKSRNSTASLEETLVNKVDDGLNMVNKLGMGALNKLLNTGKFKDSDNTAVKLLRHATSIAHSKDVTEIIGDMQDANTEYSKAQQRYGEIGEFVNEIRATTHMQRIMEKTMRLTQNIGQTRKNASNAMQRVLRQQFNSWKTITAKEKASITQTILRSDVAGLLDYMNMNQALNLVTSETKRQAKINELETAISHYENGNDMLMQTKSLGFYMATQSVANGLVKNAESIAIGLGSWYETKLANMDKDLFAKIDQLATLYAITYVPEEQLATFNTLAAEEADAIKYILKQHQQLVQASKEDFKNNPLNYAKGYMPEKLHSYRTLVFSSMPDEIAELEKQGFVQVNNEFITQDSSDRTEPRVLLFHPDYVYARYKSGALELNNSSAKGTEIYTEEEPHELKRVAKEKYNQRRERNQTHFSQYDPKASAGSLVPTYDAEGALINYRYEMQGFMRDSYLQRNNDAVELLSILHSTLITKPNMKEHYQKTAKVLYEDAKLNYVTQANQFILIDPESSDPEVQQMWRMLPYEFKQEAKRLYGKGKPITVRANIYNMTFGFKTYSITEMFDKLSGERNFLERVLTGLFEGLFKDKGRTTALNIERLVQAVMGYIKETIVVRSGRVLIGNVIANLLLLALLRIPPTTIIKNFNIAWTQSRKYSRLSHQLHEIDLQLSRATPAQAKDLNRVRQTVIKQLADSKLARYMEAGVLSTIIDDVSLEVESTQSKSIYEEKLDNLYEQLPEPVRNVFEFMTIGKSTPLYQFLADATQWSDFAAKYTIAEHYMQTHKEAKFDDAIAEAQFYFINFDIPQGKYLEYMNSIGLLMFTKFALRFQKVLFRLLKEKPAQLLMQNFMVNHLTDFAEITDPFILNDLGNPFQGSISIAPDALGDLPTLSVISTLF